MRNSTAILLCSIIAVGCIVYGIFKGEPSTIRANAETTCYSCIGIE